MGRGCSRRVVASGVMLVILAAAFLYRDRLVATWHDLRGTRQDEVTASPELARVAEDKLDALRAGTTPHAALSAVELESLLAYRYQGAIPGFLGSPTVELQGERVRLRARMDGKRVEAGRALGHFFLRIVVSQAALIAKPGGKGKGEMPSSSAA